MFLRKYYSRLCLFLILLSLVLMKIFDRFGWLIQPKVLNASQILQKVMTLTKPSMVLSLLPWRQPNSCPFSLLASMRIVPNGDRGGVRRRNKLKNHNNNFTPTKLETFRVRINLICFGSCLSIVLLIRHRREQTLYETKRTPHGDDLKPLQ